MRQAPIWSWRRPIPPTRWPRGRRSPIPWTVTNNGPEAASNVVLTDNLPGGLTLVSTSGCAEDPSGVSTCSLGTVAANTSKNVVIVVTVDPELDPPVRLTNNVTVSSSTEESNAGE